MFRETGDQRTHTLFTLDINLSFCPEFSLLSLLEPRDFLVSGFQQLTGCPDMRGWRQTFGLDSCTALLRADKHQQDSLGQPAGTKNIVLYTRPQPLN